MGCYLTTTTVRGYECGWSREMTDVDCPYEYDEEEDVYAVFPEDDDEP